jgi:hypothetical protein
VVEPKHLVRLRTFKVFQGLDRIRRTVRFRCFSRFMRFIRFKHLKVNIMKFKVIPIASEIAQHARQALVSPQYKSLKAFVDIATGYGPCRSCLKTFHQGVDKRLFFTYNAFEGRADLPDPGPIFIHGDECAAYDADAFPPDLRELPMLFEGYDERGDLITRERAEKENIESQIYGILGSPLVDYIHLRNAEAGCFVARIEPI